MTWDDTLGNMRTLDRWREAIGLIYDAEKPDADRPVNAPRRWRSATDHTMKYGRIAGVEKPISRLVMGVDNSGARLPHAARSIFDDFFERGGNCFDTAYVYGGGA